MTTAAQAIRVAAGQIGVKESPAGSNRTKFGAWYGWNGVPWCDIFVSWVGNQAGCLAQFGGKFAYTPSHASWFKARNQWHATPRAGDIVFFDFGNKRTGIVHVGIVEKVRADGTIQTIEGNTSAGNGGSQDNGGMVARRVRSRSQIAGYGRPKYSAATKASTASKPATTGVKAFPLGPKKHYGPGGTRSGQGLKDFASRLAAKGWDVGRGRKYLRSAGNDGVYGPEYERLIRDFQAKNGLTVDGQLGEKTWGKAFK